MLVSDERAKEIGKAAWAMSPATTVDCINELLDTREAVIAFIEKELERLEPLAITAMPGFCGQWRACNAILGFIRNPKVSDERTEEIRTIIQSVREEIGFNILADSKKPSCVITDGGNVLAVLDELLADREERIAEREREKQAVMAEIEKMRKERWAGSWEGGPLEHILILIRNPKEAK
jgi:hypothetical protein